MTQGKPDLALIHGWGIGSYAWNAVGESLAEHFRVRRIDLPGYGTTPPGTGDFMQTAQDIAASLAPGTALCGWSLGALLALQAARLAPQRMSRLILVGATPCFTRHVDWPDAQPAAVLEGFTAAVSENPGTSLQRFIALFNQGDAQARFHARWLAQGLASGMLPDSASLIQGLGWLREVDLRAEVSSITLPTLLIHGENDPLMPLPAACWLARSLPDARLEAFPDAAHAPFLGAPERFTELLVKFCHALI